MLIILFNVDLKKKEGVGMSVGWIIFLGCI